MSYLARMGCLIIGVALLAGCNGLTEQQRMWLAEGSRAYDRQQYSRAIDKLTLFLSEVQDQPEVAQALYVRAMSAAQSGRRADAHADLRACIEASQDVETTWRAYVVLGTLHFEDRRWQEASAAYAQAAELMPALPPADLVLYRLGICYERSGQWGRALLPYRRIVGGFPRSGVAEAARRRLVLKTDHFAIQCGAFSQRKNAENLVITLERQGLTPYIQPEQRTTKVMHVVLVGRYATYEEAQQNLSRVRQYVDDALLWP
ncbi:MAG: SPOR domain-containing protein [Planctomycetes bacterium]|nr:SPOR domain-containing protein [Planctomycetota bacterium]